jgi:hypothetical protein
MAKPPLPPRKGRQVVMNRSAGRRGFFRHRDRPYLDGSSVDWDDGWLSKLRFDEPAIPLDDVDEAAFPTTTRPFQSFPPSGTTSSPARDEASWSPTTGSYLPADEGPSSRRVASTAQSEQERLEVADLWEERMRALKVSEEQIGRLLLGAQQVVDQAIADAKRQGRLIVEEAESRAREIIATARRASGDAPASERVDPESQLRSDANMGMISASDTRELRSVLANLIQTNAELISEISVLTHAGARRQGAARIDAR